MKIYPLSESQEKALRNSNFRINLFEGAVRSGKTFVAILRWIRFITTEVEDNEFLLFCGPSLGIIENNIDLVKALVGPENVKYKRGDITMVFYIYGKKHIIVSRDDDHDIEKICGAKFKGAFCDDIGFYPKSLVDMIITRVSICGAKMFWTANPSEDPKHFIKKDFIDLKDRINEEVTEDDGKTFQHWNFTLDDNLCLTESYKDALKASGHYNIDEYNRLVLGKWPDENISAK